AAITITQPFVDVGGAGANSYIKATAPNANATNDILLTGKVGTKYFLSIDNSPSAVSTLGSTFPPISSPVVKQFDLGQVDTNRAISTQAFANGPITTQRTLVDATL